MLLSIGLMVKNESKFLARCLNSLVPILDGLDAELIIVDTGSTDNTVEIAKKYTDKVYHHEWFDDFGGMRNVVLSYTRGKWFFYLDGDEVLENHTGIIDFFKSKRHKKFNSAFIDMKNFFTSDNEEHYGVFQALRLFRNDEDFHFKGIVHEQPQAKAPVARIEGSIVHYGYVSDDKKLMEYKFKRNVDLINKVLEKDPENIYHLFQLSQSYAMYGKYRDALKPIKRAYDLAKAQGLARYMYVANQLASVYFKNKLYRECEVICKDGLRVKDGYIDLYYFQAMSQAELGEFKESISTFKKYLTLVTDYESGRGMVDLTMAHRTVRKSQYAYLTLCRIHKKLGNYQEAVGFANKITSPELAKLVVPHLVDIHLFHWDIHTVKELYEKWLHDGNVILTIERTIENKRMSMETEEKRELSSIFEDLDTPYGMLNVIRNYCSDQLEVISPKIWHNVADIDLRNREVYYGDFVLLFIKNEKPIVDLLSDTRSDKITGYFMYLFSSYKDFLAIFKEYFDNERIWETNGDDAQVYRIKSAGLYALLQQNILSDEEYEYFFRLYLEVGIKYIEECYNPRVLSNGNASWAVTDADGFLFIMRKVYNMDRNSVEYVQCLREALANDGKMKKGIELLLKEVQKEVTTPEHDEFNTLKISVQEAINNAINKGELETAVALINEYEDIVGVDAPLCAFKGIMFMIEGNHEEARNTFLLGLQLEPDNEDLLYNLNYIDSL